MIHANQLSTISQYRLLEIEAGLLPRRAEILATIRDHSPCTADFLYRRFLGVSQSTIRYDLLQLQKIGFITKLGNTRGAMYAVST